VKSKKTSGLTRVKLVIAYNGGAYQGWQGLRSGSGVQDHIEKALAKIIPGGTFRVQGASRTDAGVHALGQAAHADLPLHARLTPSKLRAALNACLPDDIRIVESTRVPPDFHARFHAKGKQYRYTVWNHAAMNPLLRGRAWHVPAKLDLSAMKRAARQFVGTRDFRSLTVKRGPGLEDAVRTLTRCELKRRGPELTFIVEGSGFLYRMCRGIVGTLVQVGKGRAAERVTAPAEGLVLWKVFYKSARAAG
jgi:tRNA pseudouridine38-40 synthase